MTYLYKYLTVSYLSFCLFTGLQAQGIITPQQAIELALNNNFGVQIGNNNIDIAANNKSILNSGFLPTLNASAGANYNLTNVTANLQNGTSTQINGATSSAYNAGLNLNYTLFDGLGRWYSYKQLKEQYNLSEMEARTTMENAVIQTLSAYYDVAVYEVMLQTYKEAVQVSANRLKRAESSFSYGQGNKLAVLNAQVDLSNDSINISNAQLALDNAKRTFNAIVVQDIETDFSVDPSLTFFQNIDKEEMRAAMLENNTSLNQAEQDLLIGQYNVKKNRSGYLPTIAATAQYGWNRNNNNEASFLASSVSYGLSTGATLSWNLFDGGTTKTAVQNSKIQNENLAINLEQVKTTLQRDFEIAWADYTTKIYLYQTQEKNVVNNQDNFMRTNEQFKLGQASSVEYRQAQQNLLTAANQAAQSKFSAKLAEYKILQLSGLLLETSF